MKPIAAHKVVPHQDRMCLLRDVLSHDASVTRCDLEISPTSTFQENGSVASWVGLEYMAQAVAAHAGMRAKARGRAVEIGFLLGTRMATFSTDSFPVGQTLHISARHVWGEGDLFSFDCAITDAKTQKLLASAQLNVFKPGNLDAILSAGAQ